MQSSSTPPKLSAQPKKPAPVSEQTKTSRLSSAIRVYTHARIEINHAVKISVSMTLPAVEMQTAAPLSNNVSPN